MAKEEKKKEEKRHYKPCVLETIAKEKAKGTGPAKGTGSAKEK